MPTFNLDVIYGAAGESIDDWTAHGRGGAGARSAARLGLRLDGRGGHGAGRRSPSAIPTTTIRPTSTRLADELLEAAGLANYEVSNWARPGHESRHNFLYWRQADYRGFGCAAHSHDDGRRWWNVRTPDRYIELIEAGTPAESAAEVLDDEARRVEGLQLMLRTRDGVAARLVRRRHARPARPMLVPHPDDPDRVVLTRAGRLMANEVSVRVR